MPTIAENLATAVALAQADAAKLDAVVHGPAAGPTSLVATNAGDVKTLARITAEAAAAAAAGVVPFTPPVPWVSGLNAVVGPPATAVIYLGESYFCNTGHVTGATFAPDAAKWTKFAQKGVDGTNGVDGVDGRGAPQGRLTLETGVPVMSTDQAGKTVVYYTPYGGGVIPIWDPALAKFVLTAFNELSNDLTQSVTGKAGPAAAGPYQMIDLFVWNDAGTARLTRAPKWNRNADVTMTIAAPCVVTWAAHGLLDGATVVFTTTGALPTGVGAYTYYFVTKIDANSFKISTSLANQIAGTYIATTGVQSGIHSCENNTKERKTGAGSPELEVLQGIPVNKYAIDNGPAARCGTWVGTIYCNGASQVDFKMGSSAAAGGEAVIGIWNAYNRATIAGRVMSSDASWGLAGGGVQTVMQSSATWRATLISGRAEDSPKAHGAWNPSFDQSTSATLGVSWNSLVLTPGDEAAHYSGSGWGTSKATHSYQPPFEGLGYFTMIYSVTNYTSSYHNASGAYTSLKYDWRY